MRMSSVSGASARMSRGCYEETAPVGLITTRRKKDGTRVRRGMDWLFLIPVNQRGYRAPDSQLPGIRRRSLSSIALYHCRCCWCSRTVHITHLISKWYSECAVMRPSSPRLRPTRQNSRPTRTSFRLVKANWVVSLRIRSHCQSVQIKCGQMRLDEWCMNGP